MLLLVNRHISKAVTEFCPYLGQEHTILVTYLELNLPGKLSPGYKKGRFECDYIEECEFRESCPIKSSAPDTPF